jgi:hypothetical protein
VEETIGLNVQDRHNSISSSSRIGHHRISSSRIARRHTSSSRIARHNTTSSRTARHPKKEMLNEGRFILSSSEARGAQHRLTMMSNMSKWVNRRNTKETVNADPTIDRLIRRAVIEIT